MGRTPYQQLCGHQIGAFPPYLGKVERITANRMSVEIALKMGLNVWLLGWRCRVGGETGSAEIEVHLIRGVRKMRVYARE